MPTLNIDGVGKVKVGDEFLKLSPEEQNRTVEEIVASMKPATAPTPEPDRASQRKNDAGLISPTLEHGLSLGLSDELAGAARAVGPLVTGKWGDIGGAYRSGQAAEQARIDAYRAEQKAKGTPVGGEKYSNAYWPMDKGTSEEILGGMIAGGARTGAPRPAPGGWTAPTVAPNAPTTRLGQYAQSGGEGAGMGAIAGFGHTGQDPKDKLAGTAAGALTGGALGIALPAAFDLASGAKGLWNRFTGGNPARRALDTLTDTMEASGVSPTRAANRLDALGEQGTLTDAGGVKMRSLAREATVKGTRADAVNTTLERRQAGASGRILDSVRRTLSSADDAAQTVDDLMRERATAADQLYRKAYDQPIRSEANLRTLMRNSHMQSAWRKASDLIDTERDTARAALLTGPIEGASDDVLANAERVTRLPNLLVRRPDGGVIVNDDALRTTQVWDYVKRALDDEIASKMTTGPNGLPRHTNESRIVNNLKNQMLSEIDRQNPAFAKARNVFAGQSEAMEAVDMGRRFYQGDAGVTVKQLEAMTEHERELFRVGVADAIRDRLEGTRVTHNAAQRIFGTPDQMQRLRASFPKGQEGNNAYREFQKTIVAESQKMRTRRIIPAEAGSQTQLRQQASQDFGGAALDVASGNKIGMLRRIFVGDGMPPEVADEILKRAVNVRPEANAETLREIESVLRERGYWDRIGPQARQMILSGSLGTAGAAIPGRSPAAR